MTKLSSHFSDVEWLEKVHNLLIEIARASLSDLPRLPERVSTEALPLAQNAQVLQENTSQFNPDLNWAQQSKWLEDVRQLLLELSRIALSERPKLPDNIAQRALMLAETAQDLRENLPDNGEVEWENEETPLTHESKPDEASTSTEQLLQQLQNHLQAEQARSSNPQLPQWQQVLTLLDVAKEIYSQIHQSSH
ncbi:hypothetical protein [Lyngbya sp. PCC 8106]|uniref:hypothetical protein n=1 Tax=Lyngbya sp. (strain PCC 8106) TaxID=313612 RepID=UPI0000EAD55E|nr:hypothetical protein [Lyngbya sp. PCC 8106]EAW37685.1 inorganic pyrophosphatase [Lyngbya sp. PCC 8106]